MLDLKPKTYQEARVASQDISETLMVSTSEVEKDLLAPEDGVRTAAHYCPEHDGEFLL